MAQINLLADQLKCRIGRESAFQTTASTMVQMVLSGRQRPLGESAVQMLASKDLGLYRHDPNAPIRGLEMGSPVKFTCEVKAVPARLTSSATPYDASNASALSHTILCDHWLGGLHVAAGSTVAASPSPAVGGCTVGSGHGSRFVVGQIVLINGYARTITAVSTDALTWTPDLPSAPSASDAVLNTYSFYRAEAQTQSLTIETAYYESGTPASQRRARGTVGQCAWSAEMGQLATLAFDGMAASTDGPGDLSISVTEDADDMGAPIRWDGIVDLFAASSTTNPTHTCVRSVKVVAPNKWTMIRCGSDENTVSSAVATGGREDPITVEMVVRFDADYYTGFNADTTYRAFAYTAQGTGTSQRFDGFHFPALRLAKLPVESEIEGLTYVTLSFVALQSTITSGSDIARSPLVYFKG